METYQKQILGIENWQPEPIESLVSSVPVQEGEILEKINENTMPFSLAPEYSKEQLRQMNSRKIRFSMRLRLEARPY